MVKIKSEEPPAWVLIVFSFIVGAVASVFFPPASVEAITVGAFTGACFGIFFQPGSLKSAMIGACGGGVGGYVTFALILSYLGVLFR